MSVTLFACLFAAQAAVIVMSPVLVEAAADLHVSTATAGQLRTATGLAAAAAALLVGPLSARLGLRRLLLIGSLVLAIGSTASAAAPTFGGLLAAQVPVGAGVGILTTAATLASAEWVAPELRSRVLSWALVGQPAAWIVGMPLIGTLGRISWRIGWLGLPVAAAIVAGALIACRSAVQPSRVGRTTIRTVIADATLGAWLTAELSANAAWAGTLVYAGALFAQSYGVSTASTGWLLAVAAAAYVVGNISARRLVQGEARTILITLSLLLAALDAAFGAIRPDTVTSTVLFSAAAFAAGARTLVSSSFALSRPPQVRPTVMSLRTATMQLGYFLGSSAGGVALAVGGYGALGASMGLFFGSSALALALPVGWAKTVAALPVATDG
ncbi:MAG TPA: MFS transporter [Gaiellales bacterium]|nr:MFS transporter [Gaiellales bacterium]